MKQNFQDRIDDYILGRMSESDKVQFEVEVDDDEAKKAQLEFAQNLRQTIKSREDKLQLIRVMQSVYNRKHNNDTADAMSYTGVDYSCCESASPLPQRRLIRNIWWKVSGIAAILVIGLFVVNPFGVDSSLNDYNNEMLRGDEDDIFEIETPALNDSIVNDTITRRDTIRVINE